MSLVLCLSVNLTLCLSLWLSLQGWNKPGFKPTDGWEKAVAYAGAAAQFGQLSLAQYPSVAIAESHAPVSIKPVKVTPPPSGLRNCPTNEIGAAGSGAVELQCPDGQTIEEITFASYGTPEGLSLSLSPSLPLSLPLSLSVWLWLLRWRAGAGRWIQGTVGDHCADRKYVVGCIFWEDIASKTKCPLWPILV